LTIHGDIITYGDNVTNYALEGGEVTVFSVDGEIIANGENSKKAYIIVIVGKSESILEITNPKLLFMFYKDKVGKDLILE